MTKRINRLVLQAIAATLIAAFFNSCSDKNDDNDWATFETNNIIDQYYVPKKAFTKQMSDTSFYVSWYQKIYTLNDSSTEERYDSDDEMSDKYCYNSDKSKLNKYLQYASYYGDTVSKRLHNMGNLNKVSAVPLLSINVTTKQQFDSEHPANSNINGLLLYWQYYDLYNYLHGSDKDGQPLYKSIPIHKIYGEFVDIEVDDINQKPFYMVADHFYLTFKKRPETSGKYTFLVELTFADDPITGEKIEVDPITVEMSF